MIRLIEQDGWRYHSQKGSHRQYKHPTKQGRVTIPGKPGDDLTHKLLNSIFTQAHIERSKP